jgi:hypothetical protein
MKGFGTFCGLYMKQVNPYVQRTLAIVLNAADNVRARCAKHTDKKFGNGGTASHAAEKARKAERRAQEAAKNTLNDKLLRRLST